MSETKKCMKCGRSHTGGMDFEVMKVTTWKTGNARTGITAGQELEGFEEHGICEECIQAKLRQIDRPLSQFPEKFKTTVFLFIAGLGLMIAFRGTKDAGYLVGLFCVVFFAVKLVKFLVTGYKKEKNFARFSENNARFVAAWECLSEVAPRKDARGRGVFFIPATKATYGMSEEDFMKYYRLSEENAQRFHTMLQKKRSAS